MAQAATLFTDALGWLREQYCHFRFFVERDVVWTVQMRLLAQVQRLGLPYRVYNDHPMVPGTRRSLSTDLAIVAPDGQVLVAAEFKYEPSHQRADLLQQKFPVVFWGHEGVGKGVARVQQYVSEGRAAAGYSVFIDEGGAFRHRTAHPGSAWERWEGDVWVLVGPVGF
jgi:hypothetical protein